jgi:hypothetical protein
MRNLGELFGLPPEDPQLKPLAVTGIRFGVAVDTRKAVVAIIGQGKGPLAGIHASVEDGAEVTTTVRLFLKAIREHPEWPWLTLRLTGGKTLLAQLRKHQLGAAQAFADQLNEAGSIG